MLYNQTPLELIKREPEPFVSDLPKWGRPILEFVGKHYFLEADQIVNSLFGSGNRTGRKKLVELFKKDFLSRYEIYCEAQEVPIIGYSLGETGVRVTRYLAPKLSINRAQEYIIANEFFFMRGHLLDAWTLYNSPQLLVGEIYLSKQRYGIWAPREEDTRIKSLLMETAGMQGIVAITPNLTIMKVLADKMEKLNLNKPIYYTSDNDLETLWYKEDGFLKILEDTE